MTLEQSPTGGDILVAQGVSPGLKSAMYARFWRHFCPGAARKTKMMTKS